MPQMQRIGKTATRIFNPPAEFYSSDTCVQYHDTVVVRFNQHRIYLNSGGWRTATTKARMNQPANQFELGFRVWQKAGKWFVTKNPGKLFSETIPFKDRMELLRESSQAAV